jgi:hypothetical protein
MGLDQYAYAVMPHKDNTDFDWVWGGETLPPNGVEPVTRIAQWRKHPNLQGWMRQLWERKMYADGAVEEILPIEFNCRPIRLTWQDLDTLEEAVLGKALPPTQGFFFGESDDDYYREDDLEFIRYAREAIGQDMEVYYDSWW